MPVEQLALDFSTPASFDELLRSLKISNLTIVPNRRLKNGWRVQVQGMAETRTLTIPFFFTDAPCEIKQSLIVWALLPLRCRKTSPNFKKRKELEQIIRTYIQAQRSPSQRVSRLSTQQADYKSSGNTYDLQTIFAQINAHYFNNELTAIVRWGAPRTRLSFQSTKHNREGNPFYLITIAGMYNLDNVPLFAIQSIMFHEMLHIKYPPAKKNGRNTIHHRQFKAAERAFPHYESWRHWERHDLPLLLHRTKHKKRWWQTIFS